MVIRTTGDAPRTAALDASVFINFLRLERLDILTSSADIDFVVPEQVVEEITVPQQVQTLNAAIRGGQLRSERSTALDELGSYAYLRRFMGRGEAACLSMAEQRGWLVAVDEHGRFRRMARERIGEGRILNTLGILLLAIRAGLSAPVAGGAKAGVGRHGQLQRLGCHRELWAMASTRMATHDALCNATNMGAEAIAWTGTSARSRDSGPQRVTIA